MKLCSWNVNGINAVEKNLGLIGYINQTQYDIYCLQEIRSTPKTIKPELLDIKGYKYYWNRAEKNGYSGVLIYSKIEPFNVIKGIDVPKFDPEGRVITLQFEHYYLVNVYFVNAKRGLARLDEKIEFNDALLEFCEKLRKTKPVIICGDFNVAHKEIDLRNPKSNRNNAGFSDEERAWFSKLLDTKYIDTFRHFNQDPNNYTWWSYRTKSRPKNVGWRLDYFTISSELLPKLKRSEIHADVMGSDHCPIFMEIAD